MLDSVKDEEEKKKEKMIEKMETTLKNREEQLRNLVVRLQEHVRTKHYSGSLRLKRYILSVLHMR